MRRHSRAATACCFILFLAVFMAQKMVPCTFAPGAGSMDLGILYFMLPGALAGVCARRGRELKPLLGALLAAPICLVLLHLWDGDARSFWQELAWIFSALFWCSIGSLGWLFMLTLRHRGDGRRRL
ncbi:inner membrane protein YbjM [Cronobacter universalis]|nr:inner membrane protein YbjM [Cronobacter universalis]